MGTETLIVARTDAEAATFLDTDVDPRDHPFILGVADATVRAAAAACAPPPPPRTVAHARRCRR